ncbi:uncharacterized protein LOC134220411 [Armigeres subalbatus]|uniref:uncharacterized protein LOC134220411 n=1 Tax=Armigeres subalbatus TaxID=124917 RepID=UPI002ED0AF57
MSKFTVSIMVVLLSMTMVSAEPMNKEFFENLLTTASQVLHSIAEKDSTGMMKQFLAPLKGVFERFMGGGRQKRSIQNTSYVATKLNATHYQQVEFHRSWNDTQQKLESSCLVKENEIYWLDLMTTALIGLMQEMKKVIEGKQVSMKMSKGAYEQRKV